MHLIDLVIYINLERRKDRREEIEKEFERLDVNKDKIARIEGVDNRQKPYLGCHESHIRALRYALDNTSDDDNLVIAIFEDDFSFVEDIEFVNNSINKLFEQCDNFWNVVLLVYTVRKRCGYTDLVSFCLKATNAAGYIIKRRYIPLLLQNLLEAFPKHKDTGDHDTYLNDVCWQSLMLDGTWLYFNKPLGYQRLSWSDNQRNTVTHPAVIVEG